MKKRIEIMKAARKKKKKSKISPADAYMEEYKKYGFVI